MKLRFGRLLVACTLALAFCFPLFGVARAEDSDSGEKKKQEPIKRVWSAQPSLEPVTEAAKNFARSIQGQIGTTITKQRLQEQSTPKNKKNALGQSARFAVNDVNADGTRAVGGRVVTASGDLYVSYLPTADGVVGVIEASTRLPTKSKADKKRRTELSVAGFRLNKVVEYYQFAFWPKGASKSLAAVVSQPPEFVSNGIYPARAAQLLTTPKKNAKSAPKGDFEGVPVPIAWMCGTAFDPVPPDAGGENSGTTCNSSREEIAQCKGPVLCESLRSGAQSGSGSGCCCQPEQPVESQPVAIEIPKSLDPQSKEDEITIPESPELGQQPVEGGHWKKEGSIPIPASPDSPGPKPTGGELGKNNDSVTIPESQEPQTTRDEITIPGFPDSPGPQPVEGGHAKPAEEAPSQASPGDAQVAVPSNVPSLTTEDSPTLATNPSGEDKNSDEKTYNQIVNAIVDDYTQTMHECPSATVIKSLDAAVRAYPAPALKECFSSEEAEDPSNDDGESAAPEGADDTTDAAAEEEDDTPPMPCTKSEKLERLLQLARQYIPKTPEALQTAACESKGKSLEELIDDQRAFIRGTKTRLALVRKDIKDLQSGYITSFVGKVYGTLGAMQQQEAIEVAQLAAQETRLSELQNTPKPKCGVGDLKPIIQTSETIEAERKIRERLGTQQTVLGLSEVGLEVTKLGLKFGAVVVTAPASGTSVALVMALKTLAGTAVGAAGNLGEAASHLDQGSKDVSQALTDASVATAHDAALALGVAGGEQMGLLVQTLGGPRSLLFVKLLAGAGGGTTTGSLDVAVKYATEGLSPEEAAYTVGLSGIMGMVSGGTASNKLGRDIGANLLIGTLGAVASGESSTKGLVKAAVENSMLAYVGNRAANKCKLQPSQTKSKPSTDPASNPPQNLAPHLSASVTERLVPGLTEKVAGLPQGAQESINSWLREKAQKAKPYVEGQETFTVPRSDSIKVKGSEERRRVYEYDWYGEWTAEGPPVKLIEERPVSDVLLIDFVQEPSTGQVVKITDVQYVPKEPVLTGELPWELRSMPPGGVNETSPLLTADKLPRLPEGKVVVPELVADRKATWKRDISEQITKLPPEVQEPITKVMTEMEKTTKWDENSVKNIDFLVDHSFEVTGTDGKRYTVNCYKDPFTEKLVAINEVVPLLPEGQVAIPALEADRKATWKRDMSEQITKLSPEVQEPITKVVNEMAETTKWDGNSPKNIDFLVDHSFEVTGTDGKRYTVNCYKDLFTDKLVAINEVVPLDSAPVSPKLLEDPNLPPVNKTGDQLSTEAIENRRNWLVSEVPEMIRESKCPLHAQEPLKEWLMGKARNTDWNRNSVSDSVNAPQADLPAVIETRDGALYKFTYFEDQNSGRVISIADVAQIRAPIKPPLLQKSTQSSEEVTLQPFARKLTQTVSRATNYVNDMLGWAEQPKNCPPNARVGFENWLKKDLPTLDFGKKPIQFPGEEQRAIIDGIDGKYEFTFRRDTATGKVEPTGVKFLRDLLPSEQAAREWPALRQKVMDALYPANDGLPPNPRNIEETLNVLKDKGLLSEDQVTMLMEESQKAPPSSDEQAFAEFLDGFEDRLFAARKEMLNGQGESAP